MCWILQCHLFKNTCMSRFATSEQESREARNGVRVQGIRSELHFDRKMEVLPLRRIRLCALCHCSTQFLPYLAHRFYFLSLSPSRTSKFSLTFIYLFIFVFVSRCSPGSRHFMLCMPASHRILHKHKHVCAAPTCRRDSTLDRSVCGVCSGCAARILVGV